MNLDDAAALKALDTTLASIEAVMDVEKIQASIAKLSEQASAPDLWNDQENAQKVTSKLSHAQAELKRIQDLRQRLDDLEVLFELGDEDPDTLVEAQEELVTLQREIDAQEVRTLLSGEYDEREALVTIRSEAGGVDAADFAEMLMRMYLRWSERHGYPTEVYDTSYAEEAGIKSATFQVKAPYAYGTLSVEQGTHRLVRISPFDNQGRRQTSFAGVEVAPVVETSDHVEIDEKELRVDVYRSSGPGRPGRQHHRLRGPDHPHPHRDRGVLPERALADPEPRLGDDRAAGQAARPPPAGGEGDHGRAQGRRQLLGQPDALLRAAPVPDGQGSADELRGRQSRRRCSTATSTSSSRPASAGAARPTTRTSPTGSDRARHQRQTLDEFDPPRRPGGTAGCHRVRLPVHRSRRSRRDRERRSPRPPGPDRPTPDRTGRAPRRSPDAPPRADRAPAAAMAAPSARSGNMWVSSTAWWMVTMRQYDAQNDPSVQWFCRNVIRLISERAATGVELAGSHLVHRLADLFEFGPQMIVDRDQVPVVVLATGWTPSR